MQGPVEFFQQNTVGALAGQIVTGARGQGYCLSAGRIPVGLRLGKGQALCKDCSSTFPGLICFGCFNRQKELPSISGCV